MSKKTDSEPRLSIGAVSRATGIPVETLRTWERRYGFDQAARSPTGHRLYPLSSVAHLRRVAAALAHGHRPADALKLSVRELEALLDTLHGAGTAKPVSKVRHRSATTAAPVRMRDLIDAVRAFDGAAFRFGLEATEARLEPLEFLEQHIQPLMVAVGKAWAKGGLDIRHEHFASSHVADVLRDLRHRLQRQDSGPTVAIASFPDDRHEIGPLMASVVFADAGWNVVYLGADTPASQLTALAKDASLEAVAVGVSSTAPKSTARALRTLAAELPDFTRLVVGGTGVPNRLPGVVRFPDLARLRRWAVEVDTRQQRGAPRNLRRRSPKRS